MYSQKELNHNLFSIFQRLFSLFYLGHKHRLRCLRQGIDPAQSMLLTPFSSASPSRTPSECSYSPKSLQKVPMMTSLLGSPSMDNKTPREVRTSLLETPEQFMQIPSRMNANNQLLPNKVTTAKVINKKTGKKAKDGPSDSNATVAGSKCHKRSLEGEWHFY